MDPLRPALREEPVENGAGESGWTLEAGVEPGRDVVGVDEKLVDAHPPRPASTLASSR